MTEAIRNRACRALTEARSVGNFYFKKVYVVGDELTFSKKVADRMLEDAKLVRCVELRQINRERYFDMVPEDITSIKVEEIEFEDAYKKVNCTDYVPQVVLNMVYHDMDEIGVSRFGHMYVRKDQQSDFDRATKALEEIKRIEAEEEAERKAEKAARREANKKLAAEKKAKREAKAANNEQ